MKNRINKPNLKNGGATGYRPPNETIRGTTKLLFRVARMRIKSRYKSFSTWFKENSSMRWYHWTAIAAILFIILRVDFSYKLNQPISDKNPSRLVADSSKENTEKPVVKKENTDGAKEVPKNKKNGTGDDSEFAPADPDKLNKLTTQQYINKYKGIAIKEMRRTKVPASITLAQGILESASGNSRLAKDLNNHFGIKCHSTTCCKGHCKNYTDDSHKDFFRNFKTPEDSYIAHSYVVLKERYTKRLKGRRDYKTWAYALQDGGYATGKNYAKKIIRIIEEYKLYKFDN
jgi:flagellum-specific peptidoglycan hydrolase FlgJ